MVGVSYAVGRCALLCALFASGCGGAERAEPIAVSGSVCERHDIEERAPALRAQAAAYAQEGVLDVAAELLERAAAIDRSGQADVERALLEAHAFERAHAPAVEAREDDPAEIARALSVITDDPVQAIAILEPLTGPGTGPLAYELLGRAHLALHQERDAHRAFARGRSRADAAGQRIGILPTTTGAVEHIAFLDGRLIIVRARDVHLVGGYQAMGTHSVWLELWEPREAEPLARVAIGPVSAFDAADDAIVLCNVPIGEVFEPTLRHSRFFDPGTLAETSAWRASDCVRTSALGTADTVLTASGNRVREHRRSDGVVRREVTLSGQTPGIMYDNVPVQYDTQAALLEQRQDGSIVAAASDGTLRVFSPNGRERTISADAAPAPPTEMHRRAPLALRVAGVHAWTVHGDGRIVRWDLARGRAQIVSDGSCSDSELGNSSSSQGAADPSEASYCTHPRGAALDATRALLVGARTGSRVRDVRTGSPVAVLDTLASRSWALADVDGAWLGGVSGEVERWDTRTGLRTDVLARASVSHSMDSLTADGRFIAVREPEGERIRVYDTVESRRVEGIPEDAGQAAIANGVLVFGTRAGTLERWDLARGRRIGAPIALSEPTEYRPSLSSDGTRAALNAGDYALVVDGDRLVARFDVGAPVWSVELSADGARLAVGTETEARLYEVRTRRQLRAWRGESVLSFSPSGTRIALRTGPNRLRVVSGDGRELGRIATRDLPGADDALDPIPNATFVTDDTLLIVGPDGSGGALVYRWRLGERAQATEVQVLLGERIERNAAGTIAFVYDGSEIVHVLRVHDGALLATAYSTADGGWVAQSAAGAVDGPARSRGAMLTLIDGAPRAYAWSLGWDRFAVPHLLARAAAGELVSPTMPALVRRAASGDHEP